MSDKISFEIKSNKYSVRFIELLFWSILPYLVILIALLVGKNLIDNYMIYITLILLIFFVDFKFRRLSWIIFKLESVTENEYGILIEYFIKNNKKEILIKKENLVVAKIAALTKPPTLGIEIFNAKDRIGSFYADSLFSSEDVNKLYNVLKGYSDR